ncbi:winged helix-turn-helix transcriptional regulator [Chryseolinea soli]|nr:helix-turn-helix domain-containing protein [Chryseolinea soli]
MPITTYDASLCMMTRIFEMIGGKWKPIILYLIQHDINRFGSLKRSMPRISKKVLTEQLRELEEDQLIARRIVLAHPPQIIEYSLTSTGISLRQLIDEMVRWGVTHLNSPHKPEWIRLTGGVSSLSTLTDQPKSICAGG